MRAYKQRDSNPKGPLRPRECPVDIRSAACPSMHSMRRTPYAQHTGKSLMARQIKGLEPNAHYVRSYAFGFAVRFFNESPYSSSEKKAQGRCVRENVRWTFDQQRVQACTTACAERPGKSLMARQIKRLEPNAPFVSANYFILYCVFKLS